MSDPLVIQFILKQVQCPTCGVRFGIDNDLFNTAKSTGKDLYCTNGHAMRAIQENPEANRLARIVERQEAELEQLRAALRDAEDPYADDLPISIGPLPPQPTLDSRPWNLPGWNPKG